MSFKKENKFAVYAAVRTFQATGSSWFDRGTLRFFVHQTLSDNMPLKSESQSRQKCFEYQWLNSHENKAV